MPCQLKIVASALKILGYILQISGMLIMFFSFFQLASSFQNTFSVVLSTMQSSSGSDNRPPCEPGVPARADCKVDFASGNAIQDTFEPLVQQYIYMVAIGMCLLFLGLILRSISELAGKFGDRGQKQPQKERIRFGQEIGGA